jgi:hypothetical protein
MPQLSMCVEGCMSQPYSMYQCVEGSMPGALGEVCVEGSCDQRFLPPLCFLGFERLLAPAHQMKWLEKESGQCFVANQVTLLGTPLPPVVPKDPGAPGGGGVRVEGEALPLASHARRLTCCAPRFWCS